MIHSIKSYTQSVQLTTSYKLGWNFLLSEDKVEYDYSCRIEMKPASKNGNERLN